MYSWSEDIEDLGFPEEFQNESLDATSNEGDKSSSCKSGSDQLSKVKRHSHGSSTDISVITRSDGSKSHSRYSRNDNVPNAESEYHLLDLLSDSGFPMTQVNGQRKLGPPPGWTKPPPDPSCEVFVGKIPRNLYEHEIYPIFNKMGDVYEIRLMMDFSGTNRGYCFVMFTKVEYANRAIKELNNYVIRPGRKIGVVASINNCRLCIGQLPSDVNPENIIKKFYEITDDVSKVAVYKYPNGQVRCALVSYNTHRGAAMARRRLLPERGNIIANVEVSVDWAHPNMSFNNVVEVIGVRDEAGKLQISQLTISNFSKRRGSQRRGCNEFLDKSIDNYLEEKCTTQSANQSKFLESSLRLQKSSGRGSSFPSRRKGYRANQAKSFDPESRGRECIKENPCGNRLRSLPISPKEDSIVRRLWYPKNQDINGNISTFKNFQGSPNGSAEFCNEDSFDSSKISNLSFSEVNKEEAVAQSSIKLLSRKGGQDGPLSFNLFRHYENDSDEKNCDALPDAALLEESVPNICKSLETRSNGDLQKPQDCQLKLTDEKCANFAELEKWNSIESFVPRVEISKKVKDDSSKGFLNQRKNFRPCPESKIPSQHKIMPNFRVLNPLTNWNGNYNPNPNEVPRRSDAFDKIQVNSSTKRNVDYYESQQPNSANVYSQNRVGNYCRECVEQSGIAQRQVYFPGEISALRRQQQNPYDPQHNCKIFNETFENQGLSVKPGRILKAPNFPSQSLYSTSSFAGYYRYIPQIYSGNSQMRLRPILNRFTTTIGDEN